MPEADYRQALDAASREWERLAARRAELDARLADLQRTIASLMRLCGFEPTVGFGLTDGCRLILWRHRGQALSARLATWLDALAIAPGARVLHVGCGTGYYSAILAEVVGPGGSVMAVDVEDELADRARASLRDWPTVSVTCGDGSRHGAPFDAILVHAGTTFAVGTPVARRPPRRSGRAR